MASKKRAKRKAKRKLKKQNRSMLNKVIRKIITSVFIFAAVIAFLYVAKYVSQFFQYKYEAERLVGASTEDTFRAEQTSIIYDINGNVITSLNGEKDSYYITGSEIPYLVKRAIVSVEDKSFYTHHGVDYKAVIRALWALIRNKGEITQGGSTITQQLAKNVFLTQEVTFERKLKEVFIAKELEKIYTKDQILEFYVNNIYFANGFYGIEAAAQGYFGKTAQELSLSEIAFLCAIPNNPNEYDPYVNPDNTIERRDRILNQMFEAGDIDLEMLDDALEETITLVSNTENKNNYVETYVRHCAIIELMKQTGFEIKNEFNSEEDEEDYNSLYNDLYKEYSTKLYTGGYRIFTSIDLTKQTLLQTAVNQRLMDYTEVNDEGIFKMQSSAVCIDNETGYVVAIVGGREQDFAGYTLNRAFQSFRQPGSSIKPILVYTPVFEMGYTPNTIVVDEPITGGPKNANGAYTGSMTVRQAVVSSTNTIAWKLFDILSEEKGISYLLNMNFSKIVESDYVPAMALGGMTYGVSTLEMASAFSTLENDGVYRTPTCIRRITDADGNVIVEDTITTKTIYEENAARTMTDVLKGVLTGGTGTAYNITDAICAGKTGTTNDTNDSWFIGYSTYYTTAVWVGYDLPQTLDPNYGRISSGMIWKTYMEKIHEGLEIKDFSPFIDETETDDETVTSRNQSTTTEETTEENQLYNENFSDGTSEPEGSMYQGN